MTNDIVYILKEILFFFNEVSIYLLFGFLVAGVLHIIFPESIIRRHLGHNSFKSVIKSTAFGIPLPLCSCGVIPVAASLKNRGASKGASISFLIATPQIGADSFMITYSLLGWVFGLFRIIASFITAIAAGIIVNIISKKDKDDFFVVSENNNKSESFKQRMSSFFNYIEYNLLGSIANSLIIGIIIAGVISAIVPDGFLEKYMNYPFLSMVIMLVIGIPMYICATASTPIAASLVMKGLSPGAALVFLLTGPATNAITISTVIKTLGKKSAAVYLLSISIFSLILGYILNIITLKYGFNHIIIIEQSAMLPNWLKYSGTIIMTSMLIWYYLKIKILDNFKEVNMASNLKTLSVKDMTCMHCAGSVKKAVESIKGTSNIVVSLQNKNVQFNIDDENDIEKVKQAIITAGFSV